MNPSSLGPIDICALAVVGFFVLMGFVRGFVWQFVRLCALLGGLVVARAWADDVAPLWTRTFPRLAPPYDIVLAYFSIFFLAIVAAVLVLHLLRHLLAALRLQSYDRLLGGVIGVVKGAMVVVVCVLLATYANSFPTLQQELARSESARFAAVVVDRVHVLFPVSVRDGFDEWLGGIRERLPPVTPPQAPRSDRSTGR